MVSLSSKVTRHCVGRGPRRSFSSSALLSPAQLSFFRTNGYVVVPNVITSVAVLSALYERVPRLFRGDFETGVYPDEWHWREGMSKDHITKEICNAWKCDRLVASVVLSSRVGALCAQLGGWLNGARIGQDDVWDKPPGGKEIAYHRDSDYISCQFERRENASVTCWLALEDVSPETGSLEYVPGSHLWPSMPPATEFHAPEASYTRQVELAAAAANCASTWRSVAVTVPKGGCAFHHQDTWHGSGPNRSLTRSRRSLGIHMLDVDSTFKKTGVGYIYGRYQRRGEVHLDDSFFPVTFGQRSAWLADYCDDVS